MSDRFKSCRHYFLLLVGILLTISSILSYSLEREEGIFLIDSDYKRDFETKLPYRPFLKSNKSLILDQTNITQAQKDSLKTREALARAKWNLINGHTKRAERIIRDEITPLNLGPLNSVAKVSDRYLSILQFLDGRYEEAWETLHKPALISSLTSLSLCSYKMMLAIKLKKYDSLKEFAPSCFRLMLEHGDEKTQGVINTFVRMLVSENKMTNEISRITQVAPYLNSEKAFNEWLRLTILFNPKTNFTQLMTELPEEVIRTEENRKLLAYVLYLAGEYEKSEKIYDLYPTSFSLNLKAQKALLENDLIKADQFLSESEKKRVDSYDLHHLKLISALLSMDQNAKLKQEIDYFERINTHKHFYISGHDLTRDEDFFSRETQKFIELIKTFYWIKNDQHGQAKARLLYLVSRNYQNTLTRIQNELYASSLYLVGDLNRFKHLAHELCSNETSLLFCQLVIAPEQASRLPQFIETKRDVKKTQVIIEQKDIEILDASLTHFYQKE